VLIADEVINGFGRTGKWFAMEHFGVSPDIMTVAKQLSSGYAPIAAALASEKISEGFRGDASKALVGGSTWGAHPVSCAVALANLDIIADEGLVENSERTGAYIASQLEELQKRHSTIVSDTRGIGLMQIVDLKRNVEAGEEFGLDDEIGKVVSQAMRDNGLLARGGASIQIAPPLVTNREEADEIVDSLDQVLDTVESTYGIG
jgi:putrescine aminotransferase